MTSNIKSWSIWRQELFDALAQGEKPFNIIDSAYLLGMEAILRTSSIAPGRALTMIEDFKKSTIK